MIHTSECKKKGGPQKPTWTTTAIGRQQRPRSSRSGDGPSHTWRTALLAEGNTTSPSSNQDKTSRVIEKSLPTHRLKPKSSSACHGRRLKRVLKSITASTPCPQSTGTPSEHEGQKNERGRSSMDLELGASVLVLPTTASKKIRIRSQST